MNLYHLYDIIGQLIFLIITFKFSKISIMLLVISTFSVAINIDSLSMNVRGRNEGSISVRFPRHVPSVFITRINPVPNLSD